MIVSLWKKPEFVIFKGAAQTKVAKLDEMISMYEKFGYINGTILVIDSGKTFYQKAFGKADFDWDIPNTLDTKFKIGSLTKPITASLILKLVQEKKISLSNTINDFLPWYPEQGKRITIHQLLNHTSGIPSFTNRPDLDQINKFRVTTFSPHTIRNCIPGPALLKCYPYLFFL